MKKLREFKNETRTSPKCGRFETNSLAKTWTIMSPSRITYEVTNLFEWVRENIGFFGCPFSEENAFRIANGFSAAVRRQKKGIGNAYYKGWIILSVSETNYQKSLTKE